MKTDVLIIPNDTLVLGQGRLPIGRNGLQIDGRFPSDLFVRMLRAGYVSSGVQPPEDIRIITQLAATGVGGRLEPLYPVPNDLLVEPGAKDTVWAQPSFLEIVSQEVVRHDLGELRLLVPSNRNPGVRSFDAFLTRKGIRLWAERKPQRLTEGEHYLPFHRLFDIERREEATRALLHLSVKPGIGFLLSFEVPDGAASLSLPVTVTSCSASRAVQLEQVQYPLPSIESKARKRWRLCVLSNLHVTHDGWPSWVDATTLTTRTPLPEGGKIVAVARRRGESFVGAPFLGAAGPAQTVIPVGTTLFVEFEEPVQIEQSAEILAGGS